jgi:hypothetical protein
VGVGAVADARGGPGERRRHGARVLSRFENSGL